MDENKQIEEIAKDLCPLYEKYKSCKTCDAVLGVGEEPCVYKCMAELITTKGYRKQEWISVADALPEDEQTVLTIDTEREMQVCFYETAQKGVFQLFHGLVSVYNITHWMPLPDAPKMKGGAE